MKTVIISGILIIAIFITALQFIPLGIEPLTELYFENHISLPAQIFSIKTYNFSFTIHNIEYQEMGYNYTIIAYDTNDTIIKQISSQYTTIPDNQSTTILQEYNLPKGFDRAKIQVVIYKDHLNITPEFKKKLWWPDPNYPEQVDIHFWVDERTQ